MEMLKRGLALVFRRRDFGLLMATQFAAQAGDGIVQTAVAKSVALGNQKGFDVEGASSPQELLRIALYLFIPYTIISPFLGVVIDRWDRRKLFFLANGLRAAVLVLVALVGVTAGDPDDAIGGLLGTQALPTIALFLAFMLTLASTRVVLAAKAAALPAALGEEDPQNERALVEANAVSQLGGALFQLGGAGVAFVAAATVLDAAPIVLAGAIVYAAGAAAALALRRVGETRPASTFGAEIARVVRRIVEGVREVAATAQAAAAITTYFWLRLLWSFSIVGIGFVARELVQDEEMQVIILTGGAGAAGAGLGFLLASKLTARAKTSAHLVLGASAIAGLAVVLLGGLEMRASIALLAFFLGFGFFLGKISLDTMVQEALGDDFRGRAFSLYDIAYNLAWVIAAAVMKLLWSEDAQGVLLAGMGLVFLVGIALIGGWFRRAGLLGLPSAGAPEASRP